MENLLALLELLDTPRARLNFLKATLEASLQNELKLWNCDNEEIKNRQLDALRAMIREMEPPQN